MDVILREDYTSLGHIGDKVSVKAGYFRNYLAPKGIAVEAESSNAKQLGHVLRGIMAKRAKKKDEALEFAKKLQGLSLVFVLKLGTGGKSFGSITSRDLEAAFKKENVEVNRKQIRLPEPIKSAGSHTVDIKVHADVIAPVTISVVSEKRREPVAEQSAADAGDEAGQKGRGRKPRSAGPRGEKRGAKKASEGDSDESNSTSEQSES